MTHRDRQRVSRVVRQRLVRSELKQDPHHRAHLLLVGAAVAEDGLLDAQRRMFADGHPCVGQAHQDDTARLRHRQCRAHITGEEQRLHTGLVRAVPLENGGQGVANRQQPPAPVLGGRRGKRSVREVAQAAALDLDHPVPGSGQSGIDAQDYRQRALTAAEAALTAAEDALRSVGDE